MKEANLILQNFASLPIYLNFIGSMLPRSLEFHWRVIENHCS